MQALVSGQVRSAARRHGDAALVGDSGDVVVHGCLLGCDGFRDLLVCDRFDGGGRLVVGERGEVVEAELELGDLHLLGWPYLRWRGPRCTLHRGGLVRRLLRQVRGEVETAALWQRGPALHQLRLQLVLGCVPDLDGVRGAGQRLVQASTLRHVAAEVRCILERAQRRRTVTGGGLSEERSGEVGVVGGDEPCGEEQMRFVDDGDAAGRLGRQFDDADDAVTQVIHGRPAPYPRRCPAGGTPARRCGTSVSSACRQTAPSRRGCGAVRWPQKPATTLRRRGGTHRLRRLRRGP